MSNQSPFKWRHFEAEIIVLCVRWYLRYSLSYRDLEEMMRERGLHVDHTTMYRWVQRYAPELDAFMLIFATQPFFETVAYPSCVRIESIILIHYLHLFIPKDVLV